MKNKLIYILLIFLIIVPFKRVSANTDNNGSNFSVRPIYPSTQDKDVGESGYFKLNLSPEQSEELKIEVKNYSSKRIEVKMSVNRAVTSNTGLILYNSSTDKGSKLEIDSNKDFEKMIDKHSEEILLEPYEEKIVSITITTPKEPFEGEILGGIHFKEKEKKDKNKKMVTNVFSYSIPVILKESTKTVQNNLSLVEVRTGLRNYHPFIETNISNNSSSIVREMSVEGTIYSTKNNEKWYTQKLQNLQMAPYSNFDFGFDLKDSEFIPGDYRVELIINADGEKYHFKKDFSISSKEASEKNKSAVHVSAKQNNYFVYLIGVGVCIILIAFLLFIKKVRSNNKKKKNSNKKTKNNNKKTKNNNKKTKNNKKTNSK